MNRQSVIVVGAGILGCTLASELARRGCKVTVLDAAEPGNGTTAATFGWVNSNGKQPLAYFNLNFRALEAHERWAGVRTNRRWFHQTGNIEVAGDHEALAALEDKVARMREHSYDSEMLSAEQLRTLEPAVDFRAAVGGAFFRREGWVDVSTACATLLQEVLSLGGSVLPFHRVTEVDPDGTVEIADGPGMRAMQLSADVVVLTAGNGIPDLAGPLGLDFPILSIAESLDETRDRADDISISGSTSTRKRVSHPTVGLTCTTSPVLGGPRHMLRFDDVTMRPASNGGLSLTDHPTGSQWDAGDPRLLTVPDALLGRARMAVPALEHSFISNVTLGNRVLPRDGITIADWVGQGSRLYAVATHSGVTLAPHLAETVAEEIRTGARDDTLSSFGLDRFEDVAAV